MSALRLPFVAPFTLIRDNGETWVYNDLPALAAALRGSRISLTEECHTRWGMAFGEAAYSEGNNSPFRNEWIVRDLMGTPVTGQDVYPHFLRPVRPIPLWRYDHPSKVRASELGLPIPGTGKRRGGHYHRQNAFVATHRAYEALISDMRDPEYQMRHLGRKKMPPNNWDDERIACRRDRSWKNFRRTQWKAQ
jgi:hypothetical protein